MKPISLAKRNALLTSRTLSWGAGALVIVLGVLAVRLLAPGTLWYVLAPVFRAGNAVSESTHTFFGAFGNAASLANENALLENRNETLASANRTLEKELSALASVPASQQNIVAGVAARPPESGYDTLVLGAGTTDGVALGMEAFAETGVPVGLVSSVAKDFAHVALFSAPGARTAGWVGKSNTPVTLVGEGAGAFSATVARSAAVAVGDTVFVPGPGALPVGSVIRIDGDPLSPTVTLRIRPGANPFSIAWVDLRDTGSVPTTFATSTPL